MTIISERSYFEEQGVLFNTGEPWWQPHLISVIFSTALIRSLRITDTNTTTTMNNDTVQDSIENQHSTTVFISDETSKVATKRDFVPLMKEIILKQDINDEQSIKSFLSKPVLLADGILTSTDGVSTFPQVFIPPDILNLSPIFTDKLSGFLGFKATTVLTLQINANRFIQGRYLLNFYPTCGPANIANSAIKVAMHNHSLVQRTSVPGVQIDLNCETQVQLKIPFVSSYPFYSLRARSINSTIRSIGVAQLHPYVSTSANCNYTIYAHFEDIQLIGATVPQSATESEQKSKGMGTVETNLRKLTLSTKYASRLPLIGSSLESLGWVSDIGANIASVWGWSKPTSNKDPIPVVRHRGYQTMNVDGADISTNMSFSCRNEIGTVNGIMGSNVDEMSLKYIQSIPAWFATAPWNTADLKEKQLFFTGLSPFFKNVVTTDNGNSVRNFVPCAMPCLYFNKFRGSFNITLKIVKTEFHSGRLAIVFVPGSSDGGMTFPAVSYSNSYYCHRHIIDIRYGNEWTFNFPYISDELFRDVGSDYGQVFVYVENSLTAPASVSSSVSLLFEVSGGEDLEYAQPALSAFSPYYPTAPQSANGGQFACDKVEEMIGSSKPDQMSTLTASLAIGEQILSLRQLLKIFHMRGRTQAKPAALYYSIVPYMIGVTNGSGTSGAPSFPITSFDYVSSIGVMFGMARGSMRTKLFDLVSRANGSLIAYTSPGANGKLNDYTAAGTDSRGSSGPLAALGLPTAFITVNDGLSAEIQTPMYSTSYAFPVCDTLVTNAHGYDSSGSAPDVTVNVTNSATVGNAPIYLRAAGDDFSFGYFISTVPVIFVGSAYLSNFT